MLLSNNKNLRNFLLRGCLTFKTDAITGSLTNQLLINNNSQLKRQLKSSSLSKSTLENSQPGQSFLEGNPVYKRQTEQLSMIEYDSNQSKLCLGYTALTFTRLIFATLKYFMAIWPITGSFDKISCRNRFPQVICVDDLRNCFE